MYGLYPVFPTNGLSGGTLPSSFILRILPARSFVPCARSMLIFDPVPGPPIPMYSIPSWPKQMRDASMSTSSATKMSRTSVRALPSQVPRRIELLAMGESRPSTLFAVPIGLWYEM